LVFEFRPRMNPHVVNFIDFRIDASSLIRHKACFRRPELVR
jgi:hypothetical protein